VTERSGTGSGRPRKAVEDVGLRHQHLVEPQGAHDRDQHEGAPDDHVDAAGLEAGRVDVIVGGAIVLVTILRALGFDDVLVSEADILDGLARTTLQEQ
jgi:hypothetical protein